MIQEKLEVGVYGVNCYIIGCEETKIAAVIDPGGNFEEIMKKLSQQNVTLKYIILTHGHGDHIGGVINLKKRHESIVLIHYADNEMLLNAELNLSSRMSMEDVNFSADEILKNQDILEIGMLKAKVIHTPGHTKGSICLKVNNRIFTGDTIFKGSIGRSDLYGGNYETLINSIHDKLMIFDDDVELYPGHGPSTTIGYERKNNPFIK